MFGSRQQICVKLALFTFAFGNRYPSTFQKKLHPLERPLSGFRPGLVAISLPKRPFPSSSITESDRTPDENRFENVSLLSTLSQALEFKGFAVRHRAWLSGVSTNSTPKKDLLSTVDLRMQYNNYVGIVGRTNPPDPHWHDAPCRQGNSSM